MSALQSLVHHTESRDVTLGKNLVIARMLAEITQQELANTSGVSRATIAQLETGSSDPRLSTVVDLARALRISPIVLLTGPAEVKALAELPADLAARPINVPAAQLARMELFLNSGLLSDRGRAARLGAAFMRESSDEKVGSGAIITAGIFSAFLPRAVSVGTVLGRLLE